MKATPVPLSLAHVAEDHGLHIHCRAQRIGNSINAPVVNCTPAHPGIENGGDRDTQLLVRIFGNSVLLGDDDLFFGGNDVAQVVGFQIGVASAVSLRFEAIHHPLKLLVSHPHHNLAKERRKAAISVERKTRSPVCSARPCTVSSLRPRLSTVSIIPGIENAAPERTETSKGFCGSPKRLPTFSSILRKPSLTWSQRPSGKFFPFVKKRVAGFRRDNETRRHRQTGTRHLAQSGAFSAEQALVLAATFLEKVDPLLGSFFSRRLFSSFKS